MHRRSLFAFEALVKKIGHAEARNGKNLIFCIDYFCASWVMNCRNIAGRKELDMRKSPIISGALLMAALFLQTSPVAFGVPVQISSNDAYVKLSTVKIELQNELKTLRTQYTRQHPQVLLKQDQLNAVNDEIDLLGGNERLGLAGGDLLVREALLKAELRQLRRSYANPHPDVVARRAELAALTERIRKIARS
jgi:hypothetical protein